MCTVLKLTRSSFYKWKATQALRVVRTCADGLLGARIAAVFDEENGLYGAKRITASLNEAKEFARVNHKKVARIMKNMNLRGVKSDGVVFLPFVETSSVMASGTGTCLVL